MASTTETPPSDLARRVLAAVRAPEADRIRGALRSSRVLTVLGEAEVGKTETLRQALAEDEGHVLRLDLAWAASEEHLAFLLARQIASAFPFGAESPSSMRHSPLPSHAEQARSQLAEILGGGLGESLRVWPSGRYGWAAALEGVEALAQNHEVLLWVDHLEAPRLSFRHPVKVGQLLWSMSELVERACGLRLLVSGREAAGDEALGPRAALRQRGQALSLRAPTVEEWWQVAELLEAPAEVAAELARLTSGHVRTMLLALTAIAGDARADRQRGAEEVLRQLAAHDDGLATRAIEHACSLHRLGGQVLTQAALGQRPYANAQRGATTTQDLSKALKRLRLAGLLRHEQRWTVVNPLVEMRLRWAAPAESPTSGRRPWS